MSDEADASAAGSRRPPAAFYLALVLANLLLFGLIELGARIYFSREIGTRALWYGTDAYREEQQRIYEQQRARFDRKNPENVSVHEQYVGRYLDYAPDQEGSYSKYRPHRTKQLTSVVTGETATARINNHGFRGRDFSIEKPEGVRRVLALGASSTFGYGNRDHETYPHLLEQLLNEEARDGERYEVINFGIPHATSYNLVALFLAEGLALDPDFVTVYSGANDSSIKEEAGSAFGRLWLALRRRLLLVEFTHHTLEALLPPESHLWRDAYARRRSEVYLRNLERLHQACREHGVRLVVATQQAASLTVERESRKGLRYEEEQQLVREQVEAGRVGGRFPKETWFRTVRRVGQLPKGHGRAARQLMADLDKTRIFLVHGRLMEDLRAWAAGRDVGFVDAIAALDDRRDRLTSWVHLHPDANRVLAEALAAEILGRPLRGDPAP